MRRADNCQDLLLVSVARGRWVLGERQPDGKPPRLFHAQVFESREAGEWAAFRRRWQTLAGRELELP